MTKGYLMTNLIEKMQSPDQDFRFMGLNDLMAEIKQDQTSFTGDESMEVKVLNQVLALVEDKISEVKNQAVKWRLIKIIRQTQMEMVVDKLIDFSGGKDEELRDISGLALKTITAELPPDGKVAASACAKLTPKLLGQAQSPNTPPEALIETLSILSILITRFPALLSTIPLSPEPLPVLAPLLSHQRPVVRKRAIVTISQFIPLARPDLFNALLRDSVFPHLDSASANLEKQRTTVQLVAAVARNSPGQVAPILDKIVPGVLKAAAKDDDELREGALQALEQLVLRCPTEVTGYLDQVVQVANQYIKYDPNYAGDDDEEMDVDEDADADDSDDDLADEYSDDEDTSYKIRRSATKLLASVIATRPELLVSLYKNVSPVLISRFGDREETVRLEVWATYAALLNQTAVYGGFLQGTGESGRGKRKRDEDEPLSPTSKMDVEESPYTLLKAQVPQLAKALLNQLKSPKTAPATLQAGFSLLNALLVVLPGSLASHVTQIFATSKMVLSTSPTTSTSTLHLTCLGFLALFFGTHPKDTYSSNLGTVIPPLLRELGERHPRVSSETFRVFSSLLNSLKPLAASPDSSTKEWVEKVWDTAYAKVSAHDTDAEVRLTAEDCLADLWICATPLASAHGQGKEWESICRASSGAGAGAGAIEGALRVVTKVGSYTDRDGEVLKALGESWVNGCVDWVVGLLKRPGKQGKVEVFTALDVLLNAYTFHPSGVPAALVPELIGQVRPFISTSTSSSSSTGGDIQLLSHALVVISLLLALSPKQTFPVVEKCGLLNEMYTISYSPLVSGTTLEATLGFWGSLVRADGEIATHVVPGLVLAVEKAQKALEAAAAGPTSPVKEAGGKEGVSPANVAKCVAMVVKAQMGVAAGAIVEYAKNFKKGSKAKTSLVVLSLLILGELGRFIDMSPQKEIFNQSIELFGDEREEVRIAAAFAAGNIAIGNLQLFLPILVSLPESDPKKRLLSLHALKEVVTHCTLAQLESVADMLWAPLFEGSAASKEEETTRNVAAACIGKLATTHPGRYLPQLRARIQEQNAATRATVVSAIRYTFADTSQNYDELLAPLLGDFALLLEDSDLNVRRLAISALNSAARTKPHLIRGHLSTLLPSLYKETKVNPELIRTVQMGPWTHKVDDGLDTRKTAYETMYTLLDTCLSKLDLYEFLSRVIPGLSDDSDEIKVISHMMLFRLAQVAPTAVAQRLDEATPQLEKTMKGATVTKDTVKQDLERAAELQRSALRAVAALSKIGSGQSAKFDSLVEDIKKGSWGAEFRELTSSN